MTRQGFDKKDDTRNNSDNNQSNDTNKNKRPNIFQRKRKDESGGKFEPIKT